MVLTRFCNLNPFKTDSATIVSYMNAWVGLSDFSENLSPNQYSLYSIESLKSAITFNPSYRTFGYLLKDMLISCSFGLVSCNLSDFQEVYMFDYTNCFKFNSNGDQFIGRRGFFYGLQLELYIGN